MPGITISSTLKSKLPEDERDGIDEYLWSKSGGICNLCDSEMNRATDTLEADHDVPEAEGGATNRDNLHLSHSTCNKAKRNNASVDVRPYLRFRAYAMGSQNVVRYDGAAGHFGIEPKPIYMRVNDGHADFEFPDSSMRSSPIFEDTAIGREAYQYVFVDVPRDAIYNDDECQPRTIKISQLWSIYRDLQSNPLHEPPSLRLVSTDTEDKYKLVMFDGQHKTIAAWMRGSPRVTAKVYLNITKDETVHLVNSIQAKIKKLPLSSFELSAKMSDEWAARFAEYEDAVDPDEASEAGFIAWLPAPDRARGKQAFKSALINEILDSPELAMKDYVKRPGADEDKALITETTFTNKVLDRMLLGRPLEEGGDAGQVLRLREKDNVVNALNAFAELVLDPTGGQGELSQLEETRRSRMVYQSALAYVATLVRSVYRQVLVLDQERAMLDKTPSDEQAVLIREAIQRIVDHPIWTADLDSTTRLRLVRDALSKNQDAKTAFEGVGLRLGYAVGADTLPADWAGT